jgi:hypothetical protein
MLAAAFLVVGWMSYGSILSFVTSGITGPSEVFSPTEPFQHLLLTVLFLGLLGLMIGVSTLISGRFSSKRKYGGRFILHMVCGVLAAGGTMVLLALRLASASARADSAAALLGTLDFQWRLSSVPLYQIGLFASMAVLAMGVGVAFLPNSQGKQTRR